MRHIKVIDADGKIMEINIKEQPTLSMMQGWVGGYVEKVVHFPNHGYDFNGDEDKKEFKEFYVNEDGRSMNLPHNERASKIAGQDIVGNAVLLINFKWV